MTRTDIAIDLRNVTKQYVIHHEKPTLAEQFIRGRTERFTALDGLTLRVVAGEKIGVTGPNGSGKTTLLKIISGIATPTSGTVRTRGRIVSLIDLEAGFHPDLSGYQNIFLNGMLLGMDKRYLDAHVPSIIRYADIKQFIDAPMFTYSQGMKLRLGFAVAIHAKPDILILDEGMSVGDADFQAKVQASLSGNAVKQLTMVHTSHNIAYLRQVCDILITMERGKITQRERLGRRR